MVDARKYAASEFISVEDIRGAGRVEKTIAGVSIGRFDKLDLAFSDGSVLSLNKTNTKTLMKAYGTDTDSWTDHVIALFVGPLEFQGRTQDAVLVAPVSRPAVPPVIKPLPPKPAPAIQSDMDDDIPF
jgi:hypothetical protein